MTLNQLIDLLLPSPDFADYAPAEVSDDIFLEGETVEHNGQRGTIDTIALSPYVGEQNVLRAYVVAEDKTWASWLLVTELVKATA